MIQVAITNYDGKIISPTDLATADELRTAAEQAKVLSNECERLAKLKFPQASTARQGVIPYLG